MSTGVSI